MPLVHLKVCDLEVFKNFLLDHSFSNNFSSTSLDLNSFHKTLLRSNDNQRALYIISNALRLDCCGYNQASV